MRRLAYGIAWSVWIGCGHGGDDMGKGGGAMGPLAPNAGQGGAQDFGRFRSILEEGGIPGPETLDDVGFFNEHRVDLPPPACAQDVCVHGLLGSLGNMINGADCTVVLLGFNTPLDPAELPRPPLNVSVVLDASGSMQGDPLQQAQIGLLALLGALEPDDRVHVVTFSEGAEVVAEGAAPGDTALSEAVAGLMAGGGTNLYEGLRTGLELVEKHRAPGLQDRVILVSDGQATVGLTGTDRILGLAEAYTVGGIALSAIGLGDDFDVQLMSALAEQGGGAFYYVEDAQALTEVFLEEASAFLVPLANEVALGIDIAPGWFVGGFYGTHFATVAADRVDVAIPTLQLAHRLADDDAAHGRRGGGGAMLLELIPTDGLVEGEVGTLHFSYLQPDSGEAQSQTVDILAPPEADGPGGWFMDDSVAKGFVMLNLYVGFQMAAQDAAAGRFGDALAVLRPLEEAATAWEEENPDADIADDLRYVRMFVDNIVAVADVVLEPAPRDPWPRD